eukprot:gene15929-20177_t
MAENIGAAARVMGNFGLTELRLVAPRDGWPQERAWAMASGATWPLDDAKVFDTLEEAVADLQVVYATTARNREVHLPVITPRDCAADAMKQSIDSHTALTAAFPPALHQCPGPGLLRGVNVLRVQ